MDFHVIKVIIIYNYLTNAIKIDMIDIGGSFIGIHFPFGNKPVQHVWLALGKALGGLVRVGQSNEAMHVQLSQPCHM